MHEVDENLIMILLRDAAEATSESLSILTDQPVVVGAGNIVHSNAIKMLDFEKQEDAYLINIKVKGDLPGIASIAFAKATGNFLASCLTKRSLHSGNPLDKLSKSALKETANILLGNFLTVMANRLNLLIVEHLPTLYVVKGEEITKLLKAYVREKDSLKFWSVEVIFSFLSVKVHRQIALLFDLGNLDAIIEAFDNPVKSRK